MQPSAAEFQAFDEAACFAKIEEIKRLLALGIHPDANDGGHTPLYRVINGSGERGLMLQAATLLLEAGANPNALQGPAENGLTPILLAAVKRNFEMMSLLIVWGAEVDTDFGGGTALQDAAWRGYRYESVIQFLIERGASRAQINSDGKTLIALYEDGLQYQRNISPEQDTRIRALLTA